MKKPRKSLKPITKSEQAMSKRLGVTLVLIALGAFISFQLGLFEARNEGTLTIELYDESSFIMREVISYDEGDTLLEILNNEFEVVCMNASYEPDESCSVTQFSGLSGRILLELGPLKTNWTDSYIQIEVNEEKASYGMDALNFEDNDIITFRKTNLD